MSKGPTPIDNDALAELIDRYLSGDHNAALIAELADVLRADPAAADVFVMMVEQSVMMGEAFGSAAEQARSEEEDETRDLLSILSELEASDTQPVDLTDELARREAARLKRDQPAASVEDEPAIARVIVIPRSVVWLASAAAILLLALVLWPDQPTPQGPAPLANQDEATAPEINRPEPARAVATLTAQHDARWSGTLLAPGDELIPGQRLDLIAGFAEITTRQGAKAILEAPCTVELTDSDNALRLVRGKLVGVCETPQSRQFVVHTSMGQIVDVGTRFGVSHDGVTRMRVIEGEVLASGQLAGAEASPTRLVAGQTALIDDTRRDVQVTPIPEQHFVSLWDAVRAPPRVEGEIRFVPAMPTALGPLDYEDDRIVLFLERKAYTLARPTTVTLTRPGKYDTYHGREGELAAGLTVDSYFVHLDPPGNPEQRAPRFATIHFDRPIVGIIATGNHLAQSHGSLGQAGGLYGSMDPATWQSNRNNSGLEVSVLNAYNSDVIRISDDRLTLTLRLMCSEMIDQMRVLIASETHEAR